MAKTNATSGAVAELRPSNAGTDNSPCVMLTRGELRALVHQSVLEALEEYRAGERPEKATLSGAELAPRLGLSRTRVHYLRHAGMPAIRVGEGFRYEVRACLAWLREHGS